MKLALAAIISLALRVVVVVEGQTLPKVTALVGRNTTLHCPSPVNEHRVAWIKQETRTILSLHGELVSQSDRYAIVKREEGNFNLFITNVQESDAGTYICQINSSPMKNLVIFLHVVKSPTLRPTQRDLQARIGQSVRMECFAEGIPGPTITWARIHGKKRVIVANNTNFLIIHNVSRKEAGHFLCIAQNGYPPMVSQKFHLAVMFKPLVEVRAKYLYGNFYQLSCHINAFPKPDNFGISGADFTEQVQKDSAGNGFHILLTATVSVPESKEFSCYATNVEGHDDKFVVLEGRGHPETTPTTITTTTTSTTTASNRRYSESMQTTATTWIYGGSKKRKFQPTIDTNQASTHATSSRPCIIIVCSWLLHLKLQTEFRY